MSTAYDQAVEFAMREAKIPRRSSLKKPRPRGCKPKKRSVDFSPEVTMSSCSDTSSIQLEDNEVFFNPMPNPNAFKSPQQQSTSRSMDVFSVSANTQAPQPSNTRDWSPSGAYTNPAFDTHGEAKAHPVTLQSPRSPSERQQQSKQIIGTARQNVIGQPVLQQNQQAVVVLPNGADMPTYFNRLPSKKSSVCSSKAGCWFAVGGVVLLVTVVVVVFVVSSTVAAGLVNIESSLNALCYSSSPQHFSSTSLIINAIDDLCNGFVFFFFEEHSWRHAARSTCGGITREERWLLFSVDLARCALLGPRPKFGGPLSRSKPPVRPSCAAAFAGGRSLSPRAPCEGSTNPCPSAAVEFVRPSVRVLTTLRG
uniref:Uncharacterized protein n=1 Tax=Plectus sambesii TaxID=2011161 RepID=A0A914UN94_9BILA